MAEGSTASSREPADLLAKNGHLVVGLVELPEKGKSAAPLRLRPRHLLGTDLQDGFDRRPAHDVDHLVDGALDDRDVST